MNLLDSILAKSPWETALLGDWGATSNLDLRDNTLAVADVLTSLNIKAGDRVAILLNDSPQFIFSFVAIIAIGAIAVPINMGLRVDEQRAILNDSGATLAVIEAELTEKLIDEPGNGLLHLQDVIEVERADATTIRDARRNDNVRNHSYIEFMRKAAGRNPGRPSHSADDNAPAFILYTSGSTGEPKGAMHRQSDIFYTNETFGREVLQLTPADRLFSSSRLPFAYGLGNSFTFPLLNGATAILCREKPTPEVISRILSLYKPTIFFGVPVVYNLLLDHHQRVAPLDCSSLRLCISAGEALPAKIGEEWERTFAVPVLDGIGSTEMLHMFMSNKEGAMRYGSSGQVLSGYDASLLDENGRPVAAGAEGNLWVKGDSAATGYWQRPETTAQTFVDGWVRTGDLYRCDEDGYFFHMGRSDDCFKSSGQWVSPVEVESVLLRQGDVMRAAVVEDFSADGLPCACAFIVSREVEADAGHLTKLESGLEEALRALAQEHLPRFKQPRRYLFVSELPYTATGKIQRFKLREQLRNNR